MSGIASVNVAGNELILTVHDGSKLDILRNGENISSGTGTVTINPVTIGGAAKTLSDVPVITASAKSLVNQRFSLRDLPEEELIEAVKDVHFIGIRSRTNLSEEVINDL